MSSFMGKFDLATEIAIENLINGKRDFIMKAFQQEDVDEIANKLLKYPVQAWPMHAKEISEILFDKPFEILHYICKSFWPKHRKSSLVDDINNKMVGNGFKQVLIQHVRLIVEMPARTFAAMLHKLIIHSDFRSGQELDIAFYIISRSEVDLKDIMMKYHEMYGVFISDDIKNIKFKLKTG